MTLLALDLPEDTTELALWLEARLVGLDLRRLVTELAAVHETPSGADASTAPASVAATADAAAWLGELRGAVLAEGLRALPPGKVRELLRRPELLGSLQELVLVEGGRHWEDAASGAKALDARLVAGRERLAQSLFQGDRPTAARVVPETVLRGTSPSVAANAPTVKLRSNSYNRSYRALAIFVALAACLVVMVTRSLGPGAAQVAWGWSRPGAIDEQATAATYLSKLADAGHEWFDARPTSVADVRQRILEMRDGCDRVIAAPHAPLPPGDQQWLVERCQKWREKFDAQLAALDANGDPLAVRGQTDETVNKLIGALRERAHQLAAS